MNTAIIVAGGSGQRFGGDTPKQFVNLLGRPVLFHTIEKFEACEAVGRIVLVLPGAGIDQFHSLCSESSFPKLTNIVPGGSSRSGSVRNGFHAIDWPTSVVAIHDGARPLVSSDDIARTIDTAERTGAACLSGPVTDTIKRVVNGVIEGTIDRSSLRRALTPQAFRYEILERALSQNTAHNATDECSMVESLTNAPPITIVEGYSRNIKITQQEDLIIAEALMRQAL